MKFPVNPTIADNQLSKAIRKAEKLTQGISRHCKILNHFRTIELAIKDFSWPESDRCKKEMLLEACRKIPSYGWPSSIVEKACGTFVEPVYEYRYVWEKVRRRVKVFG